MARVIHFELPADDFQRAAKFYEDVFGWKIEKWEGPIEYYLINTGEDEPGIDGALTPRESPDIGVVTTVGVEDIDATVAKVTAAGGTLLRPKMAIPGVGWGANLKDSEGNIIGLMQDDPSAK